MRIIVKFFSVFTISVTLLTPSLLFAQSPISQTPIPLIGGSYAPPAQVDVVNVVLEKQQYNDGDTIRGSFALRNERAESVPAIYYKIILGGDFDAQGNAGTIYDVKTFTPYFLRPGEFKTIQFEYTPPIGVTGKHLGIIINAFLEQGTPVSWSFPIFLNVAGDFSYINASDTKIVVNKKEFSTEEGPALYKNQVVEYHVTLQNPSSKQITITPKIDIYKRVALPPTLKSYNEKQITLAPKEKKQIVFELPDFDYKAGVYAGTILLINKEGKQQGPLLTFRYLVLGDTLTIENVTPSHTSVTKGASFSIRVDYSTPLIDFATSQTVDLGTPILEIQAYNERDSLVAEGKSTINPTKIERNKIFQLKASDDAKALRIEAKILKDDVIIAKYSTNLSSDYAIQKERKDLSYQGTLRAWVYGVIVILLLLAATGLFLLKRKKGGTLLVVGAIFLAIFSSHETKAQLGKQTQLGYQTQTQEQQCTSQGGVWVLNTSNTGGSCTLPQSLSLDSVAASPNPTSWSSQVTTLGWSGKDEVKIITETKDVCVPGKACVPQTTQSAKTFPTTCTLSGDKYSNYNITSYQNDSVNMFSAGPVFLGGDKSFILGGGTSGPGFSTAVPDEGATFTITCSNSNGSHASQVIGVGVGGTFTYTTAPSINVTPYFNPTAAVQTTLALTASPTQGLVKPRDTIYLGVNTTGSGCTNTFSTAVYTITPTWPGASTQSGSNGVGGHQILNYNLPYTFAVTIPENTPSGIYRIYLSTNYFLGGYWEIKVKAPNPTIGSFSANPTTIAKGGTSYLSWSSNNATYCTLSSVGNVLKNSSSYPVSPTQDTTYTLTCYNASNVPSPTSQLTVNVLSIGSFSGAASIIPKGGSTTLTWSSNHTDSCSLFANGTLFASGLSGNTSYTVSPLVDTTYTLTCYGGGTQISAGNSVPIKILAIDTFTGPANTTILTGDTVNLYWTTRNAASCSLSSVGNVPTTANPFTVSPTQDSTTYTLTCSSGGVSYTFPTPIVIKILSIPVFTIYPTTIYRSNPTTATLTWITKNASTCNASSDPNVSDWSGLKTVGNDASGQGSQKQQTITLPSPPKGSAPRKYTLTCTGPGGAPSLPKSIEAPKDFIFHTLLTKITCSKDNTTFGDCSGIKLVAGSSIYLKDESDPTPGSTISSRLWTFSNGKPSTCPSSHAGCTNLQIPKVSFLTEGTQTATLVVTDSAGETETISKTFKISKPSFQETAPQ